MKSTEDYINKVYEKFEETQRNHIYYKPIKLKKNNTLAIISGIAMCMVLLALTYTKLKDNNEISKNESENIKYVENTNDGTKTYIQYLKIDYDVNFTEESFKFMAKDSDLIAIISGYCSKGSIGKLSDENFTIYTNGDVNIEKIYKSNREINDKKITYSEIGGKLLINDFESKYDYDWSIWEKNYIGSILTDEEKTISYFEQILTKKVTLQSDAKYLVFLDYVKNTDSYVLTNKAYSALEYNPDTNMVKNPLTGEFEEFDWSLLENQ